MQRSGNDQIIHACQTVEQNIVFAHNRETPLEHTLHIYHPRPTPWTQVMEGISEALTTVTGGKRLPLVPFSEWLVKLQACSQEDMTRIPALKLLSSFRPFGPGDESVRALGQGAETREALGFRQTLDRGNPTCEPDDAGHA